MAGHVSGPEGSNPSLTASFRVGLRLRLRAKAVVGETLTRSTFQESHSPFGILSMSEQKATVISMDEKLLEAVASVASFAPHVEYDASEDSAVVRLEAARFTEQGLSPELLTYVADEASRIIGLKLFNVRKFGRGIERPGQSLPIGDLISEYIKQIPGAAGLADVIPKAHELKLSVPLYFCPKCRNWQLFQFEDWNMCDECALSEALSVDLPIDFA